MSAAANPPPNASAATAPTPTTVPATAAATAAAAAAATGTGTATAPAPVIATTSTAAAEDKKLFIPHSGKFDEVDLSVLESNYDTGARRNIFGYDDVQWLMATAIGAGSASRVLVVGCGPAPEIVALARYPRTATAAAAGPLVIIGCDPSTKMIDIARRRIAALSLPAAAVTVELYATLAADLPHAATGFDAATSLLVMHFLKDDASPAGKAAYLAAITARLKPNAKFFILDGCPEPEDESGEGQYRFELHIQYIASRGCPPDLLTQMRQLVKSGVIHPVPPARLRQLLAQAGFVDIVNVYSVFHFNGFVATFAPKPTAAAKS